MVALHSMTDVYKGVRAPMHTAVLYDRDDRFARHCMLAALRDQEADLGVAENQPYFVSPKTDYTIPHHAEGRLPYAEIEVARISSVASPDSSSGRDASRACCTVRSGIFREDTVLAESSCEVPVNPGETALIFIDVQNYNCHRNGGEYQTLSPSEREERYGYFFRALRERPCRIWWLCEGLPRRGHRGYVHAHRKPDAGRPRPHA